MLKRPILVAFGVVGVIVLLVIGLGASQLVSQHNTISNLNRSVAVLQATAAKDRAPLSSAKLKTEIGDVLVATLGRDLGKPGGLTGLVGSTSITGTVTQAIAGLQSQLQSLSTGQPSASTLVTLQTDVNSLQSQIGALNTRIGTAPETPDISTLLDQVTSYVNCLKGAVGPGAASNC